VRSTLEPLVRIGFWSITSGSLASVLRTRGQYLTTSLAHHLVLQEFIAGYMKNVHIDSVNLKKGKVTMRTSERAGTMTKAAVQNGLTIYFQGDEVRTEAAMTCILDNIEKKETTVVSLKGTK